MSGMCIPATTVLAGVLMLPSAVHAEPRSDVGKRRMERRCSGYDHELVDEARRRIVDGLSAGKRRVEVWKAVRSWIESREEIPSRFQDCAKAVLDVEHQPYKEAAERRRQQKEREEHSEWYALTPENQATILHWRKAKAAGKEPDIPRLRFTKWTKRGSGCPPLDWTVRTRKIGDVGVLKEPARVRRIIDADTMIVSIGSHQTECKKYRIGARNMQTGRSSYGPLQYYREHSYGDYDAHVMSIVVDGVSTKGLVSNADLDGDVWGFMRVARTTAEYGESMYVVEPTGDSPAAQMAIPVPPSVLKEHGL